MIDDVGRGFFFFFFVSLNYLLIIIRLERRVDVSLKRIAHTSTPVSLPVCRRPETRSRVFPHRVINKNDSSATGISSVIY